jgi:hypothetical protein
MTFTVNKGGKGWEVRDDDKVVRTFPTRHAARWNAKRWNREQEEYALFHKVYLDLFS